MLLAMLAAAMLLASGEPRNTPEIPVVPMPWMEQGNRHARRRDRKLSRTR